MKSFVTIPSLRNLEKAYTDLYKGTLSKEKIVLFAQWSRFDPRLGEIWIQYILGHWRQIHPATLGEEARKQPWPGVIGVLLEFAKKKADGVLRHWIESVVVGLEKGRDEQFFIGLRHPGGSFMFEDAQFASEEYRKWGYLAREPLLPKSTQVNYAKSTRIEILKGLMTDLPRVRAFDYWNALGKSISLRQAERDLENCSWILRRGNTKGRYYIKKKAGY